MVQRIFVFQGVTNLGSNRCCQFNGFDHFRLRYIVLYLVELIFLLLGGKRYLYISKQNFNQKSRRNVKFKTRYLEMKIPLLVGMKHGVIVSLTVRWNIEFLVPYETICRNLSTEQKGTI